MARKRPSEATLLLTQAQTYSNMCWLGLLFIVLTYIFYGMASGKIREAEAYKLNKEEKENAAQIKKNARNVTIVVTGLWIFGILIWFCVYANMMSSTPKIGR